jgi:transcriptional regulator with XRE-family HTH domain
MTSSVTRASGNSSEHNTVSAADRQSVLALFGSERGLYAVLMPQTLGQRIGARIAAVRAERGLTQEELGARLRPPVDPQTVGRWERAVREPSFDRITQIALVLRVPEKKLLSVEETDDTAGEDELSAALRGVSTEQRRVLAALVETLREQLWTSG